MELSATDTVTTCKACHEKNEPGMLFCMFCGNSLTLSGSASSSGAQAADSRPEGRTCPSCGRFDELNLKFCVLCGGRLRLDTLIETPPDVSKPEIASRTTAPPQKSKKVPSEAVSAKMRAIAAPERRSQKDSRLLVWLSSGVLGGALLACALYLLGVGDQITLMALPRKGLAIYTAQPYVKVTLEDTEGKNFSLGSTSSTGCLVVDDLPPGQEYRLKMSADGYETVYFPAFKLDHERATVLGFPKKIGLPPRN